MRIIGELVRQLARIRYGRIQRAVAQPERVQRQTLMKLIHRARHTQWGRRFSYETIESVEDYQGRVPLGTYQDFEPYWAQSLKGVWDVTWPGPVRYFAITSGTTSGNKLIPISPDGWRSNQRAGLDTVVLYMIPTGDTRLFDGKFLFLGGSTSLQDTGHGTYIGDMSGIQTVRLPWYLRHLYSPGREVAAIENWEEKIVRIAEVASKQDIRGISGIPSWMVILFETVLEVTGKRHVRDVWPNLRLLIHGGVDFSPYRADFRERLGDDVTFFEVYPASEGFVAMTGDLERHDLLLMLDYGIFYEFVRVDELESPSPTRLPVWEVDTETNYAIVLSTNSGLWSYVLGDTVRFTGLEPHTIRITGRTRHFLSAFGEHLIVEEVEDALSRACTAFDADIQDYTVAPLYPEAERRVPAHQWLIEFRSLPGDLAAFARRVDERVRERNDDYAAHRSGAGMLVPEVVALPKGCIYEVMKRRGKLGGQNKLPRLQNNRELADLVLGVCEELGGPVRVAPAAED
jgi:hypothetical protein